MNPRRSELGHGLGLIPLDLAGNEDKSLVGGQLLEDLKVVSTPTAGLIGHGAYLFEGRIGPGNDLLFGMGVGFHDRLMVGMSFGLQNFIGKGDIKREHYALHLEEYEVEIIAGRPFVSQLDDGKTQYQRWRWGTGGDLQGAARKH